MVCILSILFSAAQMQLPNEIWKCIFIYAANENSIPNLRRTCKSFRSITDSDAIAQRLTSTAVDAELKYILEKKSVTDTKEIMKHVARYSEYKKIRNKFEHLERINKTTTAPMQMVHYIDTEKGDDMAAYLANRIMRTIMSLVEFKIEDTESLVWYSHGVKNPLKLGPQWKITIIVYEFIVHLLLIHWYMEFYEYLPSTPNVLDVRDRIPEARSFIVNLTCIAVMQTINNIECQKKELSKIFPGLVSVKRPRVDIRDTVVVFNFPEQKKETSLQKPLLL